MSVAEHPSSWQNLLTHISVVGQSSGYHVSYGLAEGTSTAQLEAWIHGELRSLTAKHSREKWLSLPGFEDSDLRLVDVVALIYADVGKREINLSRWDDLKERDRKIATLLASPGK